MSTATANNNNRLLFYFIIIWFVINALQATFTGLDGDEAYYWMFSIDLKWGYFDHPPLVALSIKIGEIFGHGSFFTRLGTIFFSCGAIYYTYHALPVHLRNLKFYLLGFASIVLLNIYGFIVTPDASLFFFTALFFYAYRLFLEKESFPRILLLSLSILGLLYSKYHGILPVFFTFLSNPKLIVKSTVWLLIIFVIIGFSPHLIWQIENDWPTFRYHLSERIGSAYRIEKTTNYLGGQLLIWGPLTTIPALYFFIKSKPADIYLRAHYFTLWGILIFFLLSSFRSTVEPHWTLTAGVSFIVLLQQLLVKGSLKLKKTFTTLLMINVILIVVARLLFILPSSPLEKVSGFKTLFQGKQLSDSIYSHASGMPVVFVNSYTQPSLYQYYHPDQTAISYNTVPLRKNQYNISEVESTLNNKTVIIATGYEFGNPERSINVFANSMHLYRLDSFRSVNNLKLSWFNPIKNGKAGERVNAAIELKNTGKEIVHSGNKLFINYSFIKTRKEYVVSEDLYPITGTVLFPDLKKQIAISLKLPQEKGKYKLILSIVQTPFAGNFASPFYEVEVE